MAFTKMQLFCKAASQGYQMVSSTEQNVVRVTLTVLQEYDTRKLSCMLRLHTLHAWSNADGIRRKKGERKASTQFETFRRPPAHVLSTTRSHQNKPCVPVRSIACTFD